MYSNFVFLDRFLFELSCKSTHTQTRRHTHTHRDPIVAFSKNATIILYIHKHTHETTDKKVQIHTQSIEQTPSTIAVQEITN